MNKLQLQNELAVSERLPLSTAVKAVDGIIRIVSETLARGENVAIRGFGILSTVNRAERMARDPRTGEPKPVPARRTVKFIPGKELKSKLNPSTDPKLLCGSKKGGV